MGCGCCKSKSASELEEPLLNERSDSVCSTSSTEVSEDHIKLALCIDTGHESEQDTEPEWPVDGFRAARHWPERSAKVVQIFLQRKALRFHPLTEGKDAGAKQKLPLSHISAVHKGSGYLAVLMPECFACLETITKCTVYLELETSTMRNGFVRLLVNNMKTLGLTVTRLQHRSLSDESEYSSDNCLTPLVTACSNYSPTGFDCQQVPAEGPSRAALASA